MPDLFGVDIQGILKDAIGDGFPLITLRKVSTGDRSTANPSQGRTITKTPYQARGILASYADRQIDGTIVKTGDRNVLIVAGTLPDNIEPKPQDEIVAETATWKVINVSRDPAAATYSCQVREAS